MFIRRLGSHKVSWEKFHCIMMRRRALSSVNRDSIGHRHENFCNHRDISTGVPNFNFDNISETSQFHLLNPKSTSKFDKPLTPEQKNKQMYDTAMLLLSLRDPKVYEKFLKTNETSVDHLLTRSCRKVIRYYSDPHRYLPLAGLKNSKHQKGLVLHGPQVCHSLLTTVLIPHFVSRGLSIPEKHINDFIDMSLMTVQSIGKLCFISNPNNRQAKKAANNINVVGDSLQFGEQAEQLLRLLLNTNIASLADGNKSSISRKTTQLFNSTLNTWTIIASAERDYQTSKNAALRSEKLLLDLAMSQRTHNDASCLLDYVKPDTVSFNSVIQSWSKSGKYEVINGQKIDQTTTLAAERAEAILRLMQEMNGATVGATNSVVFPNNLSYELVIQAWSRSLDRKASDRALTILVNMLENFHERGDHRTSQGTRPFPSRKTFSNVLKALAASHRDDCTAKGEDLFNHMKKLGDQGYVQCKPDTIAYNSLMSIYLQNISRLLSKDTTNDSDNIYEAQQCCLRMDEIVNEMKQMSNHKHKITKEKTCPDIATYRILGRAWINLSDAIANENGDFFGFLEEALEKSDGYLRALVNELESEFGSQSINIGSDKKLFGEMISIYNRLGHYDRKMNLLSFIRSSSSDVGISLQKDQLENLTKNVTRANENVLEADKVLKGITEKSLSTYQKPNAFMVRSVFNAYSKALESKNIVWKDALDYLHRMEELLKQMEIIYSNTSLGRQEGSSNQSTIVTASNVLLRSYIKAMEISSADCEYIAQKADEMFQLRSVDVHCAPADSYTYTQMMNLLAKSKLPNASKKALQILEQSRYISGVKFDSYFVNSAMKALTANPGFELQCEDLLNDLEGGTFFKVNSDPIRTDAMKPDIITYSTLMASYVSKGTFESAKAVEDLFLRLSKRNTPDTYSLNTLLKAWCKVGTLASIERAEAILSKSLSRNGFPNDCTFQENNLQTIKIDAKPDSVSFTTIIQAYSKLRDKKAASNAERVLNIREQFCNANQSITIEPSDYTNLINKYGRHYNALKSEEILNRLLKQAEIHSIKPGKEFVLAFNAVLKNYANVAERFEVINKVNDILKVMLTSEHMKPDGFTYHYIMTAIAKSSKRSKKEKLYKLMNDILESMMNTNISGSDQRFFRPTIDHFHFVLKSCKDAKEDKDLESLLKIAAQRYSQMRDNTWNIKPTHVTYGIIMDIFQNHIKDEESRKKAMSNLFQDCCKDGNLSDVTLRRFRNSFTSKQDFEDLLRKTLQSTTNVEAVDSFNIECLPQEWKRNTPKVDGNR